jgi:hypothetical protein
MYPIKISEKISKNLDRSITSPIELRVKPSDKL